MITVLLTRVVSSTKQTLGGLVLPLLNEIFTCKTLELPWLDNANDISCIPAGTYPCKWTRSNRLSKLAGHDVYTYEVLNVPNRAGVRIHSANYFYQLKGCIALGDAHKDINIDGHLDVLHSGTTCAKFAAALNYEDFYLTIK